MAKIRINGDTSGYIEISAPAVAGSTSITLPATTGGSLLATDASGNLNVDSGTFYVDGTNNRVGIGTSSPGHPLHVIGTSLITGDAYFGASRASQTGFVQHVNIEGTDVSLQLYQTTTGSSWELGNDNTGLFRILNGGTNRLVIDTSGRVGIGTSSPSNALTVQSTTRPQLHVSYNGNGGIYLTSANDTSAKYNWQISSSQQTDSTLQITPSDSAGSTTFTTPAITIDSSRRVGIGTTSPVNSLVVSNGGAFGFEFDTSGGYLQTYNRSGAAYADLITRSATVQFRIENSEKARIDSSGRLLVGTSTARTSLYGAIAPALQIEGTSYNGNSFSIIGNGAIDFANPRPLLVLGRTRGSSGSNTVVISGDRLGDISFQGADGTQLLEAARIQAEIDANPGTNDMPGRLIFSTTADGASSPTERMRIQNNGAFTNCLGIYNDTTGAAANMVVNSSGSLQRSTSSAKYKTDIETLEDQYADALLDCRPVWYRSTCAADNPTWGWWGLIAEEVAEIDPRLVHWKTTEPVVQENGSIENIPCKPEPEGVAYDRFVPHLLNLIKRQKEQIESQGAAITALEARLSALEGA